jgi:hypothetical protein
MHPAGKTSFNQASSTYDNAARQAGKNGGPGACLVRLKLRSCLEFLVPFVSRQKELGLSAAMSGKNNYLLRVC